MNFEHLRAVGGDVPCRLAQLARDMPGKYVLIAELDRPMLVTQDMRQDLPPLSDERRERLENSGYSATILEAIGSDAEASIYENADLKPETVNGKDVLIRDDIDYDREDVFGKTNLERMRDGRAPLDDSGKPIELHHIGQSQDSPLAELTGSEHRGNGNDNILHNKLKESEIDRGNFGDERGDHWKARASQIDSQRDQETS
ncbi:MAG: HNH/ENDO VII family nuclease [Achromobacter sp.]|jgi:hypothetical protein|uniref:LHH domain-containing protein n=1 Tax=Achromobacter insuavis TaxID=1287735 RepID=A0A6J5AZ90_9BURK|nr:MULTISPECIES: HNH/ENDO VII family nuclease [Achromobacter]MBN9637475.1 HNH/ENDO VII family nuclease [Achromobacter sp.]CAB3684144.1 hypothetical protein LMG26845_04413 [Achromobacter insuavis]CUI91116.1 Uncharacterised protein [Achromobacter sp. 2789STDY5608628]CUJ30354.1 Uncharacterised protein [Achromobacter sp. 2789STDY5608633]